MLIIGENIYNLRKKAGWTQGTLAEKLQISTAAVSKWERNESYPDISLLPKMAALFNVSIDYLLAFSDTLTEEELAMLQEKWQANFASFPLETALTLNQQLLNENSQQTKLAFYLASSLFKVLPGLVNASDNELAQETLLELFTASRQDADLDIVLASTMSLISLYLGQNKLEEAEELLQQFPENFIDPSQLYPAFYLQKGELAKAKLTSQQAIYQAIFIILNQFQLLSKIAKKEQDTLNIDKLAHSETAVLDLFQLTYLYYPAQLTRELDVVMTTKEPNGLAEYLKKLNNFLSLSPPLKPAFLFSELHFSPMPVSLFKNIVTLLEHEASLTELLKEPIVEEQLMQLKQSLIQRAEI